MSNNLKEISDDNELEEKEKFSEAMSDISRMIEHDDLKSASDIFTDFEAEDQAEIINRLPDSKRELFTNAINISFNHEILPHLDNNAADDVLRALGSKKSAEVISDLDTEDAVQVIAELNEDDQQEILINLDDETRQEMEEGLAYPEDTAGRLMRKRMVTVAKSWTVGDTIDHLRSDSEIPDDFYVIFVLENDKLVGEVLLAKIMRFPRETKISDIIEYNTHPQHTNTDQEEVAYDFRKYALVEAPVVNDEGELVGTITIDDVVDVMQEEIEEDFLRAGGVSEQDIQDSIVDSVSKRFPWLFVNLLTAIAASVIIDLYQETIEQLVLLAVLMPIVASMGGNAGIQASTIAVRAIATKRIPAEDITGLLLKEMALGALNGIGIAIITGAAIFVLYDDTMIAIIFAIATIFTMMIAGLSGAGLPLLLMKLKIDPAISSGVFLTMLTDMVGFLAFLGLAAMILG